MLVAVPLLVSSSPVHANSVVLTAATASTPVARKQSTPPVTGDTIVYKTKTGKAYHKAGCSSLSKSKIEIKLKDAVAAGLTPCKNCKPPVLQK